MTGPSPAINYNQTGTQGGVLAENLLKNLLKAEGIN
jgi:hypothetical protein